MKSLLSCLALGVGYTGLYVGVIRGRGGYTWAWGLYVGVGVIRGWHRPKAPLPFGGTVIPWHRYTLGL
jgi:hypothetical protein